MHEPHSKIQFYWLHPLEARNIYTMSGGRVSCFLDPFLDTVEETDPLLIV